MVVDGVVLIVTRICGNLHLLLPVVSLHLKHVAYLVPSSNTCQVPGIRLHSHTLPAHVISSYTGFRRNPDVASPYRNLDQMGSRQNSVDTDCCASKNESCVHEAPTDSLLS